MTSPTLFAIDQNAPAITTVEGETKTVFVPTYTIPVATAGGTNIGFFRFQAGMRLSNLVLRVGDADTASAITLAIGWLYDDAAFTADENAAGILAANAVANTGGTVVWPFAAITAATRFLLPFAAAEKYRTKGSGWLVARILDSGAGGTTTAADLEAIVTFQYE